MGLPRDEEGFGRKRAKRIQHYIFNRKTGSETNLSQKGKVAGFKAGDRVVYAEGCYEHLRGTNATVMGFSEDDRIWTQPDVKTACHWTPAQFAKIALRKINN